MRPKWFVIVAVLAMAAACGGSSSSGPQVTIREFSFSPSTMQIKAGTTVTWTNRDEDAHTVAISGSPVSRPLQTGETYTHTFAQPGTYSYLCTIHPTMRGTVVVTAG